MANRQYVGARYVPKFADPVEWNSALSYETLTIVTHLGNSFTSKKPVPAGVDIGNTEYWVNTGNYNEQVAALQKTVASNSAELELIKKSGVNVMEFGAKGDGETDDTLAFQNAINYCQENKRALFIPQTRASGEHFGKTYILSNTLNITSPITVIAEPLACMWWKNITDGIGINIDYGTYGGHKGVYKFGIIQGNRDGFKYPNATVGSGKYGTGVRIANGDIVEFHATYICYWGTGIEIAAVNSNTDNCIIDFTVMDDCETGVRFNPNSGYLCDGKLTFDTIGVAKYNIVADGNGVISDWIINGRDLWCEYPDGCIFGGKNHLNNSVVNIQLCSNKWTHSSQCGTEDRFTGCVFGGCSKYPTIQSWDTLFNIGFTDANVNKASPVKLIGRSKLFNRGILSSDVRLSTSANADSFNNGTPVYSNAFLAKYTTTQAYNAGDVLTLYAHNTNIFEATSNVPIIVNNWTQPVFPNVYIDESYSDLIKVELRFMDTVQSGTELTFKVTIV